MSDNVTAPGHLLEGKYEIVGVVGEGAWGLVLEGINTRIRRKVAIKILKAEYASRADMVSRFEREALASTHIESPHVVQVYDAGVLADGRPYLVMEFLTGSDLGTHLQATSRFPVATAVDLCAQVARGLAAAHSAGVFHRDMKPSNIVIAKTKSGREIAKIVDFGISKLLDTTTGNVSHTQTGTVLGSPVYMSPEQARGSKTSDHRSDLYSLGVVLFECLTGRPPHDAEGFNALLFKIALEPAPSARSLRPEVDEELEGILRKLLTKQPDDRVQSAVELEAMLVGWLRKNGVKFAETPTDSGPRVLDGLTTSPLGSRNALTTGQLQAEGALPSLEATLLPEADEAPPQVRLESTRLVDAPSAKGEAIAKMVPPEMPSAPVPSNAHPSRRRGYAVASAAALALLVGGIVVATRRPPAGNGLVPTEHTGDLVVTSAGPEPSGGAHARPSSSSALPVVDTPSAASADAGTKPSTSSGRDGATAKPWPVALATGSAAVKAPASVAPTASAPPPTASAAGSANVGGRTIRTEF